MEEKIFKWIIYWLVEGLTFFGLAKWKKDFDQEEIDPRAKAMIQSAKELNIRAYRLYLLNKPTELFLARKNKQRIIFKHLPLGNSYNRIKQKTIDDKLLVKKILAKHHFPVSQGLVVYNQIQLIQSMKKLNYPVVLKPRKMSLGKGVKTNIGNQKELIRYFNKLKKYQPLILEEQVEGEDYRITLIGGEVRGVALREPANVIGDGQKTVGELIELKNSSSRRSPQRSTTLSPLPTQKLDKTELDRILAENEKKYLSDKVNLASGADITTIDNIHSDNQVLFKNIGQLFDAEVLGIDFKSPDIKKSYKQNKGKVLELNSLPYLNMHHYPWKGEAVKVGKELWKRVFEL